MDRREKICYGAVFAMGAALMFSPAFTSVYWFDEAYSIALVRESLPNIWRIGAEDVHPLLYYVLLRGVRCLFGENIIVYRLFSVVGMLCVAGLGPALVRRDFGSRAGLLYSAFVLFTPYMLFQATEIRMYSWAMFSIMLCYLMTLRIVCALRSGAPDGVPLRTWLAFGVSSFVAASLHYYALLAAFLLNLMTLIAMVRFRASRREALRFATSVIVQVALYIPWLLALIVRMGGMTDGRFWIAPIGVESIAQLVLYPLITPAMSAWVAHLPGQGIGAALAGILVIAAVVLVLCAVRVLWMGASVLRAGEGRSGVALRGGVALYLGIILFGGGVSLVMGTTVLYYRYLVIALPPLLLALSVGVSDVRGRIRWRVFAGAALVALAAVQAVSATSLAYDPENDALHEAVCEVADAGDGEQRPVISNDIVPLGTLAMQELVTVDEEDAAAGHTPALVYANDVSGYWTAAYDCFAPALACTEDTEALAMSAPDGEVVWVSRVGEGDIAAGDALLSRGFTVLDEREVWSPYERETYVIALLRGPVSR